MEKIKDYNLLSHYLGTYQAIIEKQDKMLYKITLSFNPACTLKKRDRNNHLKDKILYSSSIDVLKRKFRGKILFLKKQTKVVWIKRGFNI
ncbi:hypothetical protein KM918_16620 [Priestia megaterium]|jgi:hypothetical protein|uniref:hypothetical protein n=1 Tax=Priestia megaterium TaxID=1404 RepID=UPI001C240B50|nr:hypothetical protein [Priestia megaterium]MBU8688939.1 hypothetical protein [Priestia megaterium]